MEAFRVEAYFRMNRHVRIYLPMLSGNYTTAASLARRDDAIYLMSVRCQLDAKILWIELHFAIYTSSTITFECKTF